MPKSIHYAATMLVASGMILGCTTSKPAGLSSAKSANPMSFASVKEGAKKASSSIATAAVDNPVTRAIESGYKKSSEALKPTPKVIRATDPIALTRGGPRPTPKLLVSMARMQEQTGNVQQAEELYNRALQLDKNHLPATLGLAHLQDRQGQLEKATLTYVQAAKLHPKASSVHNDLGLCYARQGKFEQSADSLRTAVRLDPNKKLFRNNLATVLTEQGRNDEALVHLIHAHGPAAAHYNLGFLLHQRGNDAQATRHFAAALKSDPSMNQAQSWLAQLQSKNLDTQPTQTVAPLPEIAESSEGPQIHAPTQIPQVTTPSQDPVTATPVANEKVLPPHIPLQNPEVVRRSEDAANAPQPSQVPTYLRPQARTDSRYAPTPRTTTPEASASKEEAPSRYSGYYSLGEEESEPLPAVINRYQATATPLPKVERTQLKGRSY